MAIQRALRIALSFLIVAVFLLHAANWLPVPFLHQMENLSYDVRLNLTLPNSIDERIVIVDIDERSLAEVGRWPWGRDDLARLVTNLFDEYQVRLVAFDVVFAEPDKSSGLEVLRELANGPLQHDAAFLSEFAALEPKLENDLIFAEAMRGKDVILGYYFKDSSPQDAASSTGLLPPPVLDLTETVNQKIPFVSAKGYGANLALLQENALAAGFFDNPLVDHDGIFRRVPLLQTFGDKLHESLSLAVTRTLLDRPIELIIEEDFRQGENYFEIEGIRLGEVVVPVDREAAALVPYRGPQYSFPYVPAVDVLHAVTDNDVLRDAIVMVGTTAPGLLDLRSTPVQHAYAGVEVHANLVSGMLDDRIKQRPAYVLGYEFVVLIAVGLLMTLLIPLMSPAWSFVTTLIILIVVTALTVLAWTRGNLVLPLATPLLLTLTLFVFDAAYGYFLETRGKRQLAKLFGQYVPPELVDEMSAAPEEFSLAGESREMTVLFADVRGFTAISEGLEPRQLTQLMNEFLTPMTRVIHRHRGTIDKYMGDAIMAFWGAPLSDPEHPRHALQTAISMIEELVTIQQEFAQKKWPPLRIGIGINSGTMSVGNMGSQFRMAYTVMGDAVNLGSRLEGLTKEYGVPIIVSESVKAAADEYVFVELDKVKVMGKDRPVSIYEPLGLRDEIESRTKSEVRRYEQALSLFREQDWDSAESELFSLSQSNPDRLVYKLYLDRIAQFRSQPPPEDWDGIAAYTTK
ncbi:MAG: CHASE2 domain-containing protein [Gammaproteobacteria bacterium]